jgi:hypothetical protein
MELIVAAPSFTRESVRNFMRLVVLDREQMFVDRDDVGEQMLDDCSDANLFRSRLGLENPRRSQSGANAKHRIGAIERDTNWSLACMNRSFEHMNRRSFAQKKMTAHIKTRLLLPSQPQQRNNQPTTIASTIMELLSKLISKLTVDCFACHYMELFHNG